MAAAASKEVLEEALEVHRHHRIGLVWWSGGNAVILFSMRAKTEGTE